MLLKKGSVAIGFVGFFFMLLTVSQQVFAWGQTGHRVVGEVADSYLTPKAKAEVKRILGTETMAIASNWPDFIKSDSTMAYLEVWHYADYANDLTEQQFKDTLKADTATDAYVKLNFIIAQLKNKGLEAGKKAMYLKLLIHIVGDVHQPLHVSGEGDEGGNKIKVSWMGQPSNLHRIWDAQLIDMQQLSYTEYVDNINHTTAAQRTAWQKQPMATWFWESYSLSTDLRKEATEGDGKLGYKYNYKYIGIVNQRLLKGGVRLAGILNNIFG